MSRLDALTAPAPEPPVQASRLRAWLLTAGVGLLVALYLVWFLVYARLHLPPERYDQRAPGAPAMMQGGEFRLISLTQSTQAIDEFDGPQSADPDSVFVLAKMEATRQTAEEYFSCTVRLVGPAGRRWEALSSTRVARASEKCVPDGTALGQTVPIEVIFLVPSADADQLRGIALAQYNAEREPVITPPSP